MKILKQTARELKKEGYKPEFRRYTMKFSPYPYKIELFVNVSEGKNNQSFSVFTKTIQPIQYKTSGGANKLIKMINKEFNAKLKLF